MRTSLLLLPLVLSGAALLAPAPARAQSSTLPPVVVSASRVPVSGREVGSAVSVLEAEQFERRQDRLVGEALRTVPGVAVSRGGSFGAQTQVRIRGAEANHTLVRIDGIEVNDVSGGSEFDFANLLTVGLDRVEVVRGPQSSLYGSDAIGGVVDITSRRGSGPFSAQVAGEAGSFKTGQLQASIGGGSERYHYAVTGAGVTTDGISDASEHRGNSEKDGYDNVTLHTKLGVSPIDNLELNVVGRFVDDRKEGDKFVGGAGAVDADRVTESRRRAGLVEGRYTAFDGAWENVLSAAISADERDNFADGAHESLFDGTKTRAYYQANLFFDSQRGAAADHTLTLAAEAENDAVRARSAFSDVDRDIDQNSLVGEYRVGLVERLFLSASGRYDDNSQFKNAATWRLTGAWLFNAGAGRLHASGGKGVKNPTLFELFGFSANFTGNPNLKPEESLGGDIGVEHSFWRDRAVLDLTYFRNDITDLITGSGTTAVNQPGTSKTQGLEVTAKVVPQADLSFAFSYTYTDAEDANGTQLVRRPKHIASLNADYDYRLWNRPGTFNLGIDYTGDQTDTAFDASFNRSTVVLSSYTLVRLAAAIELTPGAELFGRIENALDEQYEQIFTFGSPGRAGYVGLRVSF